MGIIIRSYKTFINFWRAAVTLAVDVNVTEEQVRIR